MIMGRSLHTMTSARTRSLGIAFAVIASLAVASSASADEKGSLTLKTTTVVGNAKRPSVVIEVSRAKAEIKLADLQDPAVEKIVRAASKAPF
jgi:P pilus assembly chaperone PapD